MKVERNSIILMKHKDFKKKKIQNKHTGVSFEQFNG